MPTVLTIAGSDPSGGAGIQADLKVFSAFGVYGMAVITALTDQNTEGVYGIMEIPHEFIERQLTSVLSDIKLDAIKTGMLYSPETIDTISSILDDYKIKNIVVDPVIRSTTGESLVREGAIERIKEVLLPLATLITPNINEASELSGISIKGIKDLEEAARVIKDLGSEAVIITGGDFENEAIDLFYDGERFQVMKGERVGGRFHGTGCAYSASIASCLAMGYSLIDSALRAKEFVTMAIKNSSSYGKGLRILGL